ncbi:MAG: hypothetical protein WC908_02365 [Candidatus Paceibacterota bacterium]
MIKKFVPYILIAVILVQLFAPFTVGIGTKNNLVIETNKAEADEDIWDGSIDGYKNAFPKSSVSQNSSLYVNETETDSDFTVIVDTGIADGESSVNRWYHVKPEKTKFASSVQSLLTFGIGGDYVEFEVNGTFILEVVEDGTGKTGFVDITTTILNGYQYSRKAGMKNKITRTVVIDKKLTPSGTDGVSSLKPGTKYNVSLYYLSSIEYENPDVVQGTGETLPGLEDNGTNYIQIASTSITTATKEEQVLITGKAIENSVVNGEVEMPECRIDFYNTIGGCLGQLLYKLVFRPSSALFAITGKLLDVSISYSIKDTSYRSAFVVEGWKLVKDFCNMFFIFILLYIAFSTILNINSANTKQMIINVVIIGLLINFSLFATQVIIDASNVLTRVFYNESALVVGEKGLNDKVVTSQTGKFGEIRLSEAIVTKIGPVKLITDAAKVGTSTNANGDEIVNDGVTAGTFILVVLLASAVNIVGLIVFLSVSLIFIARVIGLWLAMVFAPFAFFSYMIPAMQNWEMVGWKKWWPDTIKMAFLAPVFLFFMYLIIKFLGIMSIAVFDADNKSGMDFVVAIMIPFGLVMVLMWKAKGIAKDMSGKIGDYATKVGKTIGGVALGGAVGGLALAGRQTLGRAAANLSQSNKFRDWASQSKFGKSVAKMTGGIASGSFDARGVKIAGKDLGSATGLKVGKNVKTGGFAKGREEKVKKEEEFANKMLDTGDYGMAELQGGKMSAKRADSVVEQMNKGRANENKMTAFEMGTMRARLVGGNGLEYKMAREVADQMNFARRNSTADYLSRSKFMTNKIKATKIRKSVDQMKTSRDLAATVAALAAAQKAADGGGGKPATHTTPTPHTTPTTLTTPSAPTGGGGHH